jgi:hypothetical protein
MSKANTAPENVDWEREDAFDYADDLTLPEWAWEFLRRDPDYRKSWESARAGFAVTAHDRQSTLMDATDAAARLSEWGCLYTSDPSFDARSSDVIWRPDLCSRVLHLTALPFSASGGDRFDLCDIACRWVLLRGDGHTQHLLFQDSTRSLQLAVEGVSVLAPVRLVPRGEVDSRQLQLHRCFVDFQISSRLLPSHFPREYLSGRLKRVLRALDGSLAGASHRQIAVTLFGEAQVEAEWCAAGRPLRDKVRRTINRGRFLMQGGYCSLLR